MFVERTNGRPNFALNRALDWASDQSGAVAIVFSLSVPVILGGFALAAETGYWLSEQRRIQNITDVAGYSVGIDAAERGVDCNALQADPEAWSDLEETAWRVAEASGLNRADGSITLSCPQANQIGIDVNRTLPTLLVAAVVRLTSADGAAPPQFTINPSAAAIVELVADVIPGGTGVGGGGPELLCIHATAPSGTGIEVSGTGGFVAPACRVQADSDSVGAITLRGNITFDVACATTRGTHRLIGRAMTVDLGPAGSECAEFRDNTETAPLAPTLANLPVLDNLDAVPVAPLVRNETQIEATYTHSSGLLMRRFQGLELKNGTFTFAPGLYIIDGNTFEVANNATLIAPDGVGFLLINGAQVEFGQQAVTRFGNGLGEGPLQGLVIFSFPTAANNPTLTTAEFTAETLDGIIFLPGYGLELRGGTALGEGCFVLVAETVDLVGNTALSLNCDAERQRRLCGLLGTCGDGGGENNDAGVVIVE